MPACMVPGFRENRQRWDSGTGTVPVVRSKHPSGLSCQEHQCDGCHAGSVIERSVVWEPTDSRPISPQPYSAGSILAESEALAPPSLSSCFLILFGFPQLPLLPLVALESGLHGAQLSSDTDPTWQPTNRSTHRSRFCSGHRTAITAALPQWASSACSLKNQAVDAKTASP